MNLNKRFYGASPEGETIDLYTLSNRNGIKAGIINYGGVITFLDVPDRKGKPADIVLGYDSINDYATNGPYFGCLIGRYANRIRNGKFVLNGIEYSLTQNLGGNHLHGGFKGFHKVVWQVEEIDCTEGIALKLTYLSKNGREGYPGNLLTAVTYSLTNDNELKINYQAQTDKDTIINLTHHSYFNLAGHGAGDILGHELMLNADCFTPTDSELIPTGQIAEVAGTGLDFRNPKTIGSQIKTTEGGYDTNFVLNKSTPCSLGPAARVYDPNSGRVMEIFTTQPAVQLYTANFLNGTDKGKAAVYKKHSGLCLETQHYPDSPNHENFPSVVLRPGQEYQHLTIYKFSTD